MVAIDRELYNWRLAFRQMDFRPSAGQLEFARAFFEPDDKRNRFYSLIAAARFGKSMIGGRCVVPYLLTPGMRTWIVAPQYDLGEFEWRYVLEGVGKILGGLEKRHGVKSFSYSVRSGSMALETEWDSFVRVKSAKHPQSLLGEEVDLVVMSEGSRMPGDIWETYIQARLAMREGRALLPTTPSASGYNRWVKQWWQWGHDPKYPEFVSYGPYAAIDNPLYPAKSFSTAYANTPWEKFREQYLGEFVLPSGRVYSEYDPAVHLVDDDALPWNWRQYPVWAGVDFGGTDPFCALLVAQLPDGIWYIADEHYISPGRDLRLAQHAERIGAWFDGCPTKRSVFTDHDSADQYEIKRELSRYGLHVRNARKGKGKDGLLPTIDELRSLFWQQRLFVNRERCPNVARELLEYRWEESRSVDEMNDKPYPRDWANHAMDAMRYAVCSARKASGTLVVADDHIPAVNFATEQPRNILSELLG